MEDDFARFTQGCGLKPDAQPAVRLVGPLVVTGRNRVCEDEEVRSVAASSRQTLDEKPIFVVQHQVQALARHISWGSPVDRIAEYHVVGGNGFSDRPGCAARVKELARNLLPCPDLRESPVYGCVAI